MNERKNKISIVLVDDSAVIRGALTRILSTDSDIEVVGSVSNGQIGVTMANAKKPDIIILDVEMPVMDGISALPEILKASPKTKVIMCSSLTEKGADITIKALALGAVECIVKPSSSQDTGPNSLFQRTLINLIKNLVPPPRVEQQPFFVPTPQEKPQTPTTTQTSTSSYPSRTVTPLATPLTPTNAQSLHMRGARPQTAALRDDRAAYKGKPAIIAIGSSTGGPNALFTVLKNFKNIDVPIVITQHMPATFTKILAEHIATQTGIPAFEAAEGMVVENGKIYVAQGGRHMLFNRSGTQLTIKLDDGPQENFCKPAVDPMMRSLIGIYGSKVLCVILTGMGQDGLKGAQTLVENGGRVIAQDEATSVVWGMPGAVATNGLCSAILPLSDIGPWVKKTLGAF